MNGKKPESGKTQAPSENWLKSCGSGTGTRRSLDLVETKDICECEYVCKMTVGIAMFCLQTLSLTTLQEIMWLFASFTLFLFIS